jgi:ABC-2 type transport system permease protein
MTSMNMVWLVTQKEIKTIFRNKGLLSAGFYVGGMFGVLNTLLSGPVFAINNAIFSVALLAGVFVGYSLSRFVFLREKQEKIIETLLCTPLSLKSIWLGKVIGATVPAYLFSLLASSLVTLISSIMMHSLVLPSAVILIHIVVVVPIFTTAAISLIGFCQFVLGMRENKIIGYLIVLVLVPFMYPSIFGLMFGGVNVVVSWREVGICLLFAVLLLTLTTYSSRYLSKEKIITTIPSV